MIDIFIPFYSDKFKLIETMQSVSRQSDDRYSLTVLDDASAEIAGREDIGELDGVSYRYRRNPQNLGMVGNWNQAFDAEAPLAALLHADDLLRANYVDEMHKAAERHPTASAFFCKTQIIDEHGQPVFSFPDYVKKWIFPHKEEVTLEGEDAVLRLLCGNFIFCPTMVFRLKELGDLRFDPQWRFVQDLDFTLRLLEAGKQIVGIPTVAYCYRRHRSNATVKYTDNLLRFEEENRLYLMLAKRYEKMGWKRAARCARKRTIIKLNLTYCALVDLLSFRFAAASKKVTFLIGLFGRAK